MKIVTDHVFPPIPVREFDWSAHFDGQEEGGPYGRGRTEQEAILDLLGSQERYEFQTLVRGWLMECFSMEVCRDTAERNHRFLEEALELVQAKGCTRSEAHQLVDYVFGRPAGDPFQEAGGVAVTFAALCDAGNINVDDAANTELARVWTKIEKIRAKQAAKPKHSPLPEHVGNEAKTGKHFLIRKKGYFYRPGAMGYTSSIHEAGRFTIDEAHAHTQNSDGVTSHLESEWPPESAGAASS